MKKIDLGTCCLDCFNAINCAPDELPEDDAAMAGQSAGFLVKLGRSQHLISIHTGDDRGFSWSPCGVCHEKMGGQRWEIYGLKQINGAQRHG